MADDGFVITQPSGQRTLALRESYLAICGDDDCAALLLNAAERWYAYKLKIRQEARGRNRAATNSGEIPEADESLWLRYGAKDWVRELMGVYSERTVLDRLSRLKHLGFLASRPHPKLKWDKTPQWMFQRSAVQAAVDAWAVLRAAPDLDPSPADLNLPEGEGDSTENLPDAPGNPDRDHAANLPDGPGNSGGDDDADLPDQRRLSAASTLQKGASNNTDILNRNPKTDKNTPAADAASPAAEPAMPETPTPPVQGPATAVTVPQVPANAGQTSAAGTGDVPGAAAAASVAPKHRATGEGFPWFEAVCLACYGTLKGLTKQASNRAGAAGKSLRAAGYAPEEIPTLAAWIRHKDTWRTDLSPQTLEGEAPKWRAAQEIQPPTQGAAVVVTAQADGSYYDPRADQNSPQYDPRFDTTRDTFDPDYVLAHG